jgi:hypothetical protein
MRTAHHMGFGMVWDGLGRGGRSSVEGLKHADSGVPKLLENFRLCAANPNPTTTVGDDLNEPYKT